MENILRARVLAIEMRDPSAPGVELTAIGDRTEVEMAVAPAKRPSARDSA